MSRTLEIGRSVLVAYISPFKPNRSHFIADPLKQVKSGQLTRNKQYMNLLFTMDCLHMGWLQLQDKSQPASTYVHT